ncbi:hypothetical protein CC80DRAFT_23411 [Byssothecium circinans]|uniref:Uncharacterized protein n=1 Tax=Byssothecium circinans TaxID=147558 RepID=A0A6A5U2P1_9PLEO|nr:hypothetical protein CC80DRAFT_23411 [Byssothecium circinans]
MTTVNNQGSNGDQVAPRPTVDTTLANAIKLREERIGKKAALETSSNAEQKLFEYSRYDQLSYATKRLVNAIALVEGKTLTGLNSKEQADLLQSLQNARFLSASVGKNAVFTIGIMNRAAESNVGWNTAADHFNRLKELEKMLNHVTLATDTTWRGMDTVAKFASAIDTKPREIKVSLWQWVMWLVCMLTFGLMLFGLLYVDPLSKACSRVNVMRSLELQGHAMLYSVLKEQSEQLEINKIIFDTKVDAIHNKTELAFEHIRANEIRIDNIWEALGEPNVNGTYFTIGPEGTTMDVTAEDIRKFKAILEKVDMDIHKQLHNQLKDVNTKIEFSIQHLKNDLDAIKKEWQRADIRLSARLDRVERHRGAAIA